MLQWPNGSRLERMILRLATQRDCLNFAADHIRDVDGVVVELGLGKGRTYDHLRKLFPERRILTFDRELHAMPDCRPPAEDLVLGEFSDTLGHWSARKVGPVALVHADVGSEKRDRDARLVADLAPLVAPLLITGGILLADRHWNLPNWQSLELPIHDGGWPYFGYKKLE